MQDNAVPADFSSNLYQRRFETKPIRGAIVQTVIGNVLDVSSSERIEMFNGVKKFFCEKCNFNCEKLSNWNIHLSTNKHLGIIKVTPKPTSFVCECGKEYKHSSGLSKHRKQCSLISKKINEHLNEPITDTELINTNNTSNYISKEMILEIIKQNNELKNEFKQMINEIKNNNIINNTTHNNTTNNTNFNLNFFLNERCKNAMNMMDFINELQIEFSDVENVGIAGYIEGITQIILKHMKNMDVEKRPMHCTDLKRETMYIKDQDTWDKDSKDKTKMIQFVSKVANKNLNKFYQWFHAYPECQDMNNKKYDMYLSIYRNSLGGFGEEEQRKYDEKIIRNIVKNVLVDKKS